VGKTKSEAGDADEGASLAKKRGGAGAQPEVTSITTARAAPSTPSQTPMKLPQTLADRRGILMIRFATEAQPRFTRGATLFYSNRALSCTLGGVNERLDRTSGPWLFGGT
jgi:hypothetical protein